MILPDDEPAFGPWRPVDLPALAADLVAAAGTTVGRPRIIAVDGRGASGKSTLAGRLAAELGGAVVHTDDLAWHEPFFGWRERLVEVLEGLRPGEGMAYRPPQWIERGREGAIEVAPDCPVVIVEGTGAAQADRFVDVVVWVQADVAEAERRGIARDLAEGVNGDAAETVAFWHEWMGHELRFLAADRPWERAYAVVAGTPAIELADGQYAVADGPLARVGPADLTAGELRILDDAETDDVALTWVMDHLRLTTDRPTRAHWDVAFAALARLVDRGLVAVGRMDDAPGGGIRHVAEPLAVVRRRAEAWGDDWAYAGWVVTPGP